MEQYLKYLIFIISLLFLALIMFLSYLIGSKLGLKKSLYRITYISISVIFAFIIAPYITEFILNYDLYQSGRAIIYNGLHFYRIIDFIEEVIVHNQILNDIYNLFPSLKNLLMDFPQVLFIPFAYVLSFLAILIILMPLYLYLSYKRKRRVLYDKPYSRKDRVWAGILSAIQSVFIVSIILTPINGLSRIYKEASEGLIEEDTNICAQNEYLAKYEYACNLVEGYNSSVFSLIGDSPINKYIYDSLTRINYGENETSLNKEVVSIARAGVILNKTGLLKAISIENFSDVTQLNFNSLTETDIDIVVEAFDQSLYTRDVVYEVYEWAKAYLDWLIKDLIDKDSKLYYEYDDIVGELKTILKAINFLLDNPKYLENINKIYKIITTFASDPSNFVGSSAKINLFFDIAHNLDIDSTIKFYKILMNSKVYNDLIPKIFVHFLNQYNINVTFDKNTDEMHRVVLYALNIAKIVQSHHDAREILKLLNDLTLEEVHYLAEAIEYMNKTQTMSTFAYDLINFALTYVQLKLDIPTEIVFEIDDWERELEVVHVVLQIVYTYRSQGYIDYDKAWYGLNNYNDTVLFEAAFHYLIDMLPDIFIMWLAGKDYKYLVGEYV